MAPPQFFDCRLSVVSIGNTLHGRARFASTNQRCRQEVVMQFQKLEASCCWERGRLVRSEREARNNLILTSKWLTPEQEIS
ncbi:MAG: hypothetical protein ABR607_01865 [Pyrinomonadaceae bacterium]